MPIVIRSAAFDDIPAILASEQQSPNAAHWTSEQYLKLLDLGIVLVAEQDGNLCGFICAKAAAGEWEIENIVVSPDNLRRGIASELLAELIQRARMNSAAAILLEVRESNESARRLYEKHKFLEVGRRRAYYREPVEDAMLYALRIEE
jgi:[ribosomal protein S18]-alanine N-acetyltransferase